MNKEYTKRYCLCPDWVKVTQSGYESKKLAEMIEHFPNTCPYCHEELKLRLREVEIKVAIENELYDDGITHGFFIPLKELKKLLEEV